jgi:hypothetical protein
MVGVGYNVVATNDGLEIAVVSLVDVRWKRVDAV